MGKPGRKEAISEDFEDRWCTGIETGYKSLGDRSKRYRVGLTGHALGCSGSRAASFLVK